MDLDPKIIFGGSNLVGYNGSLASPWAFSQFKKKEESGINFNS